MEKQISDLFIKIIKEKYNINLTSVKLEKPPKKDLGDFAFGCFILSKELKKSPIEISKELSQVEDFISSGLVKNISSNGPYVNIKVNYSIYTTKFLELLEKKEENNQKGTIFIDYIGTNIGKPLHIGHMCTPNQGQVLVNLYKILGYDVVSDSHIGDWGIIFGKLIRGYILWGDEKKLKENAVDHLLELYVKATSEVKENPSLEEEYRIEFKKLSSGNKESVKLWKAFTKYSIESMQVQLNRLNVKSDYNIGESFYEGLNLPKIENFPDLKYNMGEIVDELIEKNIATKNEDNSVGIVFDDNEKIPSCILQKRDGTHGYLASELSSIKYRMHNWNPEKIIYFVDNRQSLHLKQAFLSAKKAGWLKNTELIHAANGFISLKDGAMSSRKGRIIKLDKLLDESEKRAEKIILEKRDDLNKEELKELSKIIGIGAIKYGYLKKSRETDVIFDWDEFMTFDGNSGPYIQYGYVRAIRILEKYNFKTNIPNSLSPVRGRPLVIPEEGKYPKGYRGNLCKNTSFEYSEEIEVIKLLLNYDKVLKEVADKNMPNILCAYAYNLTKVFSSFYNNVHILNEKDENKQKLRILLVKQFTKTLKESFEILGIKMPEKM